MVKGMLTKMKSDMNMSNQSFLDMWIAIPNTYKRVSEMHFTNFWKAAKETL